MNVQSWASALTMKELEAADTQSSGANNGTGVDVSTMTGQVVVVLSATNSAGTDPTLDVKLQTSATVGGTYADISGATFTQVTDAADSTEKITLDIDSIATDFIRCVGTVGGTSTPTFEYSVVLLGYDKYPA